VTDEKIHKGWPSLDQLYSSSDFSIRFLHLASPLMGGSARKSRRHNARAGTHIQSYRQVSAVADNTGHKIEHTFFSPVPKIQDAIILLGTRGWRNTKKRYRVGLLFSPRPGTPPTSPYPPKKEIIAHMIPNVSSITSPPLVAS
jgi:hypothetical protein